MQWRTVGEWIGFQAVWLACALGAAAGWNWPGVSAAVVFLVAMLAGRGWAKAEVAGVLASGLLGLIAESCLAVSGLVAYAAAPGPWGLPAPTWIVALWLAFGGTLAATEALLGRHGLVKAALLGLVAGPLSYAAGARLGALAFPAGSAAALGAIALIWMAAMPLLLALRRSVAGPSRSALIP